MTVAEPATWRTLVQRGGLRSAGRGFLAPALALALCLAAFITAIASPAAAASPPPTSSVAASTRDIYAVIVGYNGGQQGLPTLQFADDDAVRFALFFRGLASSPEHVVLLADLDGPTRRDLKRAGLSLEPDGPPSRTGLSSAFESLKRKLTARPAHASPPVVYFIYAGHGLRGRVLLAPESGADAALTGLELRHWLAELDNAAALGRSEASRLRAFAFIDACRSQSLFSERGGGSGDGAGVGPDLTGEAAALTRDAESIPLGVITAAVSAHQAGEIPALAGGYFSHVLASGLAGAADADGNEQISFAELAAFVAYNTDSLASQHPWFSPPGGDLSATALDLRGAHTRLDFAGAAPGRYLVRASTGRPVFAEAVKGELRALHLTLPAGHYQVTHAVDRLHNRSTEVELPEGHNTSLGERHWEDLVAEAGSVRGAGDDGRPLEGDASTPVFTSAFTGEAVATLTVAYQAGREPESSDSRLRYQLEGAATVGNAAVGLPGMAGGGRVGLERSFWLPRGAGIAGIAVGFGLAFARSSHVAGQAFALESYTALLHAGPLFDLVGHWHLAALLEGGGGPLLRRTSQGSLSGDAFSPKLGGSLRLSHLFSESWSLALGVAAGGQWVDLDGVRKAFSFVSGELGLAWAF
jgi:hypothetical protein